jgi:acetyl-CoA decarbonylase/synthase complex subunit beta
MGEVKRIQLYSAFGYPHTSCGCFEGIAFYIPEVEGFGIVLRGFRDVTVNGLGFSTMADSTAGGRQVEGFHGISIEYMRSRKFMSADGGYDRVVWMPLETKEKIKPYMSEGVYEKIATEKDVRTIPELKDYLISHQHPVTQLWEAEKSLDKTTAPEMTVFSAGDIPLTTGGVRIILKNARITAEKVIIQPVKPHQPRGGEHGGTKNS